MNITKKKIYYKFVDLQRASYFLDDRPTYCFASKMLDKLKGIGDDEFNIQFCTHLLDKQELSLVREFIKTGSISYIDGYISKIPEWLWVLIMPIFLDLDELRQIICDNSIKSKNELLDYFKSNESFLRFGEEDSLLYAHFVLNQDGSGFPDIYRVLPNERTLLRRFISNTKIKGNFHNHTTYSDGRCSIKELKELAIKYEREYIGISDHSFYVGGVSAEQLANQIHEINYLNKEGGPIILKSVECEILKDGSLDLSNDAMANLDYVIVACHCHELMKKSEATKRIIRAIENERSDILAHPLSRIYRKKAGLYLDIHKIIDACVVNHVAIEINGDPDRLDLAPEYLQYAVNKGAMFTIDSDTHLKQSFKNINNSISIAEDYFVPNDRILNTKSISELIEIKSFK